MRRRLVGLAALLVALVGPLATTAAATRVTFQPLHGWTTKPAKVQGGLVTALKPADITSAVPGGARFTIQPASGAVPDVLSLMTLDKSVLTGTPAPASATVGTKPAAGLTYTQVKGGTPITSTVYAVAFGNGQAYTVLMEAPASQWAASAKSFKAILASVKFS